MHAKTVKKNVPTMLIHLPPSDRVSRSMSQTDKLLDFPYLNLICQAFSQPSSSSITENKFYIITDLQQISDKIAANLCFNRKLKNYTKLVVSFNTNI